MKEMPCLPSKIHAKLLLVYKKTLQGTFKLLSLCKKNAKTEAGTFNMKSGDLILCEKCSLGLMATQSHEKNRSFLFFTY